MILADAEGAKIIGVVLQFVATIIAAGAALVAVAALYRGDERDRDSWRKTRLIEAGIEVGNAVRKWKDTAKEFDKTSAVVRPHFYPVVQPATDDLWHTKSVLKLLRESTLEARIGDLIANADRLANELTAVYKKATMDPHTLIKAKTELDALFYDVLKDFQNRIDNLDTRPLKLWWIW